MAYLTSVAALRKIIDMGFAQLPSSDGSTPAIKGNSIYVYTSSHASSDFQASTGFFVGVGGQLPASSGALPYERITRHPNNVGVVPGDLVVAIQSSAGASPGTVTMHAAFRSTLGSSGYDITVR